jgi:hypothetical protein
LDNKEFNENQSNKIQKILEKDDDDIEMDDLVEYFPDDEDYKDDKADKADKDVKDEDKDDDEARPLYSLPGSASCSVEAKTVGWVSGRSKSYINMFGKKSIARYRIDSTAFTSGYEDTLPLEENVSLSANRHGETKGMNGRLLYTKRHIHGIWGVAWKGYNMEPSDQDLELIHPSNSRRTIVYILIEWDISGKKEKTWETRTALRARWGKKAADTSIYKAAQEAEWRFEEAQGRNSMGRDKTPDIGLRSDFVQNQREKSLGRDGSRQVRFSKSSRSRSPDLFVDEDSSEDEEPIKDMTNPFQGMSRKDINKMMQVFEFMKTLAV